MEGKLITAGLDEVDAKIIKDLLFDARKSFVDIAAGCNLSTATIGDRFTELEKAGIIIGSTIQVNRRTLGYNAICNVSIKVDPQEAEQVVAYLEKIPLEIPLINKDAKNNITLVAGLKDLYEVSKLKELIRKNKFVHDLKVEIWTDVKNTPEKLEIISSSCFKDFENIVSIFSTIQKSITNLIISN